jgi:hypothetical protein
MGAGYSFSLMGEPTGADLLVFEFPSLFYTVRNSASRFLCLPHAFTQVSCSAPNVGQNVPQKRLLTFSDFMALYLHSH